MADNSKPVHLRQTQRYSITAFNLTWAIQ